MSALTGLLSNIQMYSTKDGPGIRTTAFFTGCNLRCLWCSNPEAMYPGRKIMYYASRCHRCGACVAHGADGSVIFGDEGCIIDREKCTNLFEMPDICYYDAYEEKGMEMTVLQLYGKLVRDRAFYENSGGGVTFSGGECLLQREFLYEVMKLLKQDHIHMALDTAGLWDFEAVYPALELADLILYDIKAWDRKVHKQCTGTDNQIILDNAKKLADMGKEMIVRMVSVPGLNDGRADIERRLEFVKSLGSCVRQVDILRYHKLGLGKYKALGLPYPLEEVPECPEEAAKDAVRLAGRMGLKATVGG